MIEIYWIRTSTSLICIESRQTCAFVMVCVVGCAWIWICFVMVFDILWLDDEEVTPDELWTFNTPTYNFQLDWCNDIQPNNIHYSLTPFNCFVVSFFVSISELWIMFDWIQKKTDCGYNIDMEYTWNDIWHSSVFSVQFELNFSLIIMKKCYCSMLSSLIYPLIDV